MMIRTKSVVRKRIDRARLMEANRRLKAADERLARVEAICVEKSIRPPIPMISGKPSLLTPSMITYVSKSDCHKGFYPLFPKGRKNG